MKRSHRAAGLLLVTVISIPWLGCATWKPIGRDHIATTLDRRPELVRVSAGGAILDLRHPTLEADTLHALLRSDHRGPVSMPLNSIESLSVQQNDRRGARLIAGFALAVSVAFLVALPEPFDPK